MEGPMGAVVWSGGVCALASLLRRRHATPRRAAIARPIIRLIPTPLSTLDTHALARAAPAPVAAAHCSEQRAAMLQQQGQARLAQLAWRVCCQQGAFGAQRGFGAAAAASKNTYNVPEGHHGSDLSSAACHIGLGRRRDLTMRQDLRLWERDVPRTLAEVFHNAKALLVGFPGGKVCSEQQLPGYVQAAAELKAAGVDKVVCVTVGDPAEVAAWAAAQGLDKAALVQVLTDRNQSFTRMLGLELGPEGPQCQRYAGVVDNGILLRLKVEQAPAELKLTDAKSMLRTFKAAYGVHE